MSTGTTRAPRMESLFIAALVLFGFRLGVRPIGDNSMFTHLRTGVDMVSGKGIPLADPYSFTAAGHRWIVQSWLPEWTYGWLERVGGLRLVVLEQAVLCALLALLVVRLARAGSPLRTALAGTVAVGISAPYWSPRPLLFGLLCMALLITVVEQRRSPWLLVPLVWFWVQSHGSFPLGLVWLGARAGGQWLDWRSRPADTIRYTATFGAGLALSVLNPLGARLLSFPFTIGEKRAIFSNIVEWRSPNFQRADGRFAFVFLVLALLLLFRAKLAWRDILPVVAFLGAGLLAVRNLPLAAIVVAPVLGRALRRTEGADDRPARSSSVLSPSRMRINRVIVALMALTAVIFAASIWTTPALATHLFPEKTVSFLEHNGYLSDAHRVAAQDFVGNYVTLRYGRRVKIFIDDRYDMYPVDVSNDYLALSEGKPDSLGVLDRHRVDVVLWDRTLPLATILRVSDRWQQIFRDDDWVVYVRQS